MAMFKGLLKGLVDIIYPKVCIVCKERLGDSPEDEFVCSSCWEKISHNRPPFCHCCGRHLAPKNITKNICPECVKANLHFDRAFSPYRYEGIIKEIIHEFKYKNKDYLGTLLGNRMLKFIRDFSLPVEYMDLIIPIPLHNSKKRLREYNQAAILAEAIARKFNKAVLGDCLIRRKSSLPQAQLTVERRQENVKNCFSLKNPSFIKDRNILLIDDIITSGATCSEAAYTLKRAGAKIVFVLTLAN